MRQVLQDLRSGEIRVDEVPEPGPRQGYVLVAVERSVISSGTERSQVELGSRSLLGKARARPDLVRKTVSLARAEGVRAAAGRVRGQLARSRELGYSLAGRVLDAGGDPCLAPGVRVACVGGGYAVHADVVLVPSNLVVPVPEGVSVDEAAFAAPAAIALHALRLAETGPGSLVAVVGLGLIGQLATRIALAAGCSVVGTDLLEDRRRRAAALPGVAAGVADEMRALVEQAGRGRGADAVLVCAATPTSEPVELAAEIARDRARVVVVGDAGLELDRRVFYEKELSLVVARSYGAGRYDRDYEEGGRDLPAGYVRWTEGRNVEAVLDLLARGALRLNDLVTHRFAASDAARAYEVLRDGEGALAILLEFEAPGERIRTIGRLPQRRSGALRVGLVGAGSFARSVVAPLLQEAEDVEVAAVCARSGASARSLADTLGAPLASTDWRALAESSDLDALVVATPHSEHAAIAAAALDEGKSVLVEKPLALTTGQLRLVLDAAEGGAGVLLVGHNRRFAPLAAPLEKLRGPLLVTYRVAAGPLAAGHWLSDPEQGGRVLGEISHFVDFVSFLVGRPPASVHARPVPQGDEQDSLAATLSFEDGSAATLAYAVGETGKLPKERVEVLAPSGTAVLDDFRRLELAGRTHRSRRDKGHRAQLDAFVAAARGERELPVGLKEQALVAAAALALIESAQTGLPVDVRLPD
jgi:predicted dehydrogenase/threonine dehydrogenase-like Zn-dependent dehydrogenase